MLDLLKKIPRKFKILGTVFFSVAFLCFLLISNIEKILTFSLDKALGINLKVENIDLSLSKIKFDKLKVYDKKNRLILDVPTMDLIYSIFNLKLNYLNINSPSIFIINDENGINIKEFLEKDKHKNDVKIEDEIVSEQEIDETKEYIAKSIPIDNISINNLFINYKLEKNNKVYEKSLKNININVNSGKNKGILAKVISKDNPEKFEILYDNKEESFYLELKLDEIKLEEYKGFIEAELPKLKKISGNFKADLILSSKNRTGYAKLNNLDIYHTDIESAIKADLEIKLDKEDVEALIDYEIFGERNQMEAMYKDGKLYSLVQIKNINENKLSKIVPLKNSKIDLSKIDIEDIIFLTQYDKKEGLRVNFDLKPNKVEYGALSLDAMKANFIVKDGVKYIENSHIFLRVADMPTKLNLEARIQDNNKDVDMLFQIHNLDKTSNLIEDFNGIIKIENMEKNVQATLKSNIINFNTNYNKEERKLELYNEKFKLDYNKNDKKLTGNGEIEFLVYGLKNYIKYVIENNNINFEKIKIENNKKQSEKLEAKGYYDLSTKNFKFDYDASDLEINRLYKGQKINLSFHGKGEFEMYHSVLTGIGNIKGLNLSYLGGLKSLTGKYSLSLNENNELQVDFNGKVEELNYKNIKLKNVILNLGFEKEILNIKKMGNEFFSITGKINKLTQESNLKLSVNNLSNKDLNIDNLNFNIKDISGDITGTLDNPNINLGIKNIELFVKENIIRIYGKIKIKEKKIDILDLSLNNNKIKGQYDIQTKKYNLDLSIEDNLSNYLSQKNIDYALKGLINVNGVDGKLKSNLNIQGSGKFKDNLLPNVIINADYSAKNYSDGIIKVNNLEAKNSQGKNLLNFKGDINLKNKSINLISDEILSFNDLKEYTKNNDIQGEIRLNASLKGKLKNPIYNLTLSSQQVALKNIKITEINSKLSGDKNSLNIEDFSFNYLNNQILGRGSYDIKQKKYNFNLKSKEPIDLVFLNNLLREKGIKDISGIAFFNLDFNNEDLKGYFKIENFKLNDEKNYINVSDMNTDIELKNDEIKIKSFFAKVNQGDLQIDGYIKVPKELKKFSDSLNYSIDINAENLKYSKPDVANISFSSKINVTNKKIDGDIFINKGIIYDIPNDYKSIWSIISKKILNRDQKTEEKKEKSNIEEKKNKKRLKEFSQKLDFINLRVKTREAVILDIESFNIAVDEVKGKLETDLTLKGGKGKYILLGNTELLDGSMYLNANKFILDRALVSFNETTRYLPDINPDIFIDTRVTMDSEDINFGVYGRLKRLMYTLSSDSGNISGNFNSLLIQSNKQLTFEGNADDIYLRFMKNIIAGQLTQAIFGPITKNVKKFLGLSKLVIRPEVSIYNVDSEITNIYSRRNEEVYNLGAKIEAEKNLYKNKIHLYATFQVFGSNKSTNIRSPLEKNGMKAYDFGLKYQITDDKLITIGAGTVPSRYIDDKDRRQDKLNYHIDFKIRKKYHSFSEIFSF